MMPSIPYPANSGMAVSANAPSLVWKPAANRPTMKQPQAMNTRFFLPILSVSLPNAMIAPMATTMHSAAMPMTAGER